GFAKPLHLYFGVRAQRDVYLEHELAELQSRHDNLHVHIVLSEPQTDDRQTGPLARRTGLVTEAVAADLADLQNFKLYVAGPPPMVDAATALAQTRGMKHRDIHADAFYPAVTEPSLAP
ncbi:MAG: hypothetical protein ACREB3_02705, partial [Burkholderiales bacterium]